MSKWPLVFLSGFMFALLCPAQDVPPPPRPAGAPPSVESIAKSLQEKIMSIGRVSWTETDRNPKTNEVNGPVQVWGQVTRIIINSRACEIRVTWNSGAGQRNERYYSEELGSIKVSTLKEFANLHNSVIQYTMDPTPYSVIIGNEPAFFTNDQESANHIASGLQQWAQECKPSPIPPQAANSGPGLEDTLNFIANKLNGQGAVNWLSTSQNVVGGTSGPPTQLSEQYTNVAGDPRTCRLTYHEKTVSAGTAKEADFRRDLWRVEKLEVMNYEDWMKSYWARQGHPEFMETNSPQVYVLEVTLGRNSKWEFIFADQDLANRVAKALNHATELCGGGSEDPF